jgi:DnaJ-class molecular chaperone
MEFKDYYATLGVDKTASEADIKKAYRKLARQFHPDVNPGDKAAEAKFKEINEANEVLGDAEKRKKYDELGSNWRAHEQSGAPGAGPGAWSPFGGGAGGGTYRTMSPDEMQEMFGNDEPFSDFFQTFFGGGGFGGGTTTGRGGRGSARPHRGQDAEQPVELTLEEAFLGTTRKLQFSGRGKPRTIEVRIPAGVKDGARIRIAGEGGPGARGGAAGDLYLVVQLLPHERFERRGQDVYLALPMPVTTAVLGGEIVVPTLAGTTVRLKVPELTAGGRVFRLRGHGMPAVGRPDERGDLYATAEIAIPDRLSDEERRLYESLRAQSAEPEKS